uniref:Uncharacterized protein n=1 Tax=Strongyloides stercoralis TaxID=6248 RepID=A0AAF5I4E2_STRER
MMTQICVKEKKIWTGTRIRREIKYGYLKRNNFENQKMENTKNLKKFEFLSNRLWGKQSGIKNISPRDIKYQKNDLLRITVRFYIELLMVFAPKYKKMRKKIKNFSLITKNIFFLSKFLKYVDSASN